MHIPRCGYNQHTMCLPCIWIYVILVISDFAIQETHGRIYNSPEYDQTYLEDDCKPFFANDSAATWDKRVKNLTDGDSRLYGYVQPTHDGGYEGPLNCAIKVVAPPQYRLVVRIPQVEIYHDETECVVDFISVIGASSELKYCGFGTVTHSIYSTENYLIFKIQASDWDENHNYIGFVLYYTAVHFDDVDGSPVCDLSGSNRTEWKCPGANWCTPYEVVCDSRDNCGNWEEEKAGVCGLTEGAIIAISVVSILVGGTAIFFLVYCLYSKQKEKKARERRQREVSPTMVVGYNGTSGNLTMVPAPLSGQGALAEPPPPYTPAAYTNMGYGDHVTTMGSPYDTIPDVNVSMTDAPVTAPANGVPPSGNLHVQYTTANRMRPTIGEPPPVYTVQTAAAGNTVGDGAGDGTNVDTTLNGGAIATGVRSSGVSYDELPEKTN